MGDPGIPVEEIPVIVEVTFVPEAGLELLLFMASDGIGYPDPSARIDPQAGVARMRIIMIEVIIRIGGDPIAAPGIIPASIPEDGIQIVLHVGILDVIGRDILRSQPDLPSQYQQDDSSGE